MTNVSRNVINDVLRCIHRCSEHQDTMSKLVQKDKEAVRALALDMFKDMELELCNLAASLVSAPISGRMFIPFPSEYIPEEVQQDSMYSQILQEQV